MYMQSLQDLKEKQANAGNPATPDPNTPQVPFFIGIIDKKM